jgi:hypothetical protein
MEPPSNKKVARKKPKIVYRRRYHRLSFLSRNFVKTADRWDGIDILVFERCHKKMKFLNKRFDKF